MGEGGVDGNDEDWDGLTGMRIFRRGESGLPGALCMFYVIHSHMCKFENHTCSNM